MRRPPKRRGRGPPPAAPRAPAPPRDSVALGRAAARGRRSRERKVTVVFRKLLGIASLGIAGCWFLGRQPRACLPRNQQPAMPRLAMPSSLRNTTVTFLSRLRRPRAAARPSATLSRGGAGARGAAGGGPLPRRFGGRRFVHTARAKPLQIEGHIREPEAAQPARDRLARLERAPEVVALHLDAGDAPVVPHAALAKAELVQHPLGGGDGRQLLHRDRLAVGDA